MFAGKCRESYELLYHFEHMIQHVILSAAKIGALASSCSLCSLYTVAQSMGVHSASNWVDLIIDTVCKSYEQICNN